MLLWKEKTQVVLQQKQREDYITMHKRKSPTFERGQVGFILLKHNYLRPDQAGLFQ